MTIVGTFWIQANFSFCEYARLKMAEALNSGNEVGPASNQELLTNGRDEIDPVSD